MPKSKKNLPKKPATKTPFKKPVAKVAPAKPAPPVSTNPAATAKTKVPMSSSELKRMLLERKAAPKAIAFSLDEVREIAKKNEKQVETTVKTGKNDKTATTSKTL